MPTTGFEPATYRLQNGCTSRMCFIGIMPPLRIELRSVLYKRTVAATELWGRGLLHTLGWDYFFRLFFVYFGK